MTTAQDHLNFTIYDKVDPVNFISFIEEYVFWREILLLHQVGDICNDLFIDFLQRLIIEMSLE